jgi:hypothetical protein
MTTRAWQTSVLIMAALAFGACRRPGPHAAGSGYGVGIARTTWIVGHGLRGESTLGVQAPTEAGVGRVKSPFAAAYPQAGHL